MFLTGKTAFDSENLIFIFQMKLELTQRSVSDEWF